MQATTKIINEHGLNEIREFLTNNHKKGQHGKIDSDMVLAYAAEAEFQLSEGNSASFEIGSHNSIHGRTQEYHISDAGIDKPKIKKYMTVEMPDGSKWAVPVEMIARHRAAHYANEFEGDVARSMTEDTIPLFEADEYEIEDWAVNNMDWSDFDGHQVKLEDPSSLDFQEGWMSGAKGFSD